MIWFISFKLKFQIWKFARIKMWTKFGERLIIWKRLWCEMWIRIVIIFNQNSMSNRFGFNFCNERFLFCIVRFGFIKLHIIVTKHHITHAHRINTSTLQQTGRLLESMTDRHNYQQSVLIKWWWICYTNLQLTDSTAPNYVNDGYDDEYKGKFWRSSKR